MRLNKFIAALLLAIIAPVVTAAPKTCVLLGDSIMAGVSGGQVQDNAVELVSKERNIYIKNLASPGASWGLGLGWGFNIPSTVEFLRTLDGPFGYTSCYILQLGTNDFGLNVDWSVTTESAHKVLKYAKDTNKKVLMLDPIWRANEDVPNAKGNVLNATRFFLYLACNEYPGTCFFAHRGNTPMGTSAGAAHYDAGEVAAGAQLHPNVYGHRLLADWIKAEAAAAGIF